VYLGEKTDFSTLICTSNLVLNFLELDSCINFPLIIS
jgi:hypothetical protein